MGALPGPSPTMVVAPEEKCAMEAQKTNSERTKRKKKREKQLFQYLGQGRKKGEGAGIALQPQGADHHKPFLIYTINRRELK